MLILYFADHLVEGNVAPDNLEMSSKGNWQGPAKAQMQRLVRFFRHLVITAERKSEQTNLNIDFSYTETLTFSTLISTFG